MFQKTTLKNGLRVLTSSIPGALSVGIWVLTKVGSRYENTKNAGTSHFLEHMLLKGSKKWPSQRNLSIAVESNGGIFNAWTGKESTCYFIKLPKGKIDKGIEIILDMILHSKLEEAEFEKEKGIIIQEINRRDDNPDGSIWNLINKTMWPNHPLGQSVAGYKDTVKNLQIKDLKNFFDKFYIPQNMVIIAGGDFKHQDIVKNVENFFDKKFTERKEKLEFLPVNKKQKDPNLNIEFRKTEQSHLILGIRSFHCNHPDKFVLNLINGLLGIGWSSRLMLNIRTQKSLTYTIHSEVGYFSDTGSLLISSGIKNEKLILAIEEIINELKRLKKEPVKDGELYQTKEKLKGRFLFGIELPEDQAEWYGMQEIFQPKILSPKEVLNKIDKVTNKDIMRVSEKLFTADRLNLALIGPFKEKDKKTFYELLKKID